MVKRIVLLSLLLGVFAIPFAISGRNVSAAPGGNTDLVAFCQQFRDTGGLDGNGLTFGDCINYFGGAASEHANNAIAGRCGFDIVADYYGDGNRGQCIQALDAETP